MRGQASRALGCALLPAVLLLAGCNDKQNSLAPKSHQAKDIASLFWWMMGGAWLGLGLVVALLVWSWKRRNRRGIGGDTEGEKPAERAGWYVVVGAGIVMPIVVISTLFVISDLFVIRTTEAPASTVTKLTVQVIGHDWWWEIRYPKSGVVTANELHIPVDTPVRLEVKTADVIHSFWVPQLNRKIDTLPGKTNRIELRTSVVGTYRGECSEFCGLQHAHMSLYVFADRRSAFRRWLSGQAKPAATPATAAERRGLATFSGGLCSSCHTIQGTSASGDVGPDLTHLASRRSIGALTLPNGNRELRAWIRRSQHYKPGNQMPDIDIHGGKLDDLVAYLGSLR